MLEPDPVQLLKTLFVQYQGSAPPVMKGEREEEGKRGMTNNRYRYLQ